MGFLAPLYMIGLLAVGIPILLHLIKRTPQGRQMFSSLMFLTPSPPRLTKRSRLNNLLLLLLRALAISILALAFARPYFHWGENRDKDPSTGRRIIFLVDTSASMRRPELWTSAKAQVEEGLRDVTTADEVGLYFFDSQLRPGLTMAQWNQADPATRLALFRAKLAETSPRWSATRLGDALAAAADLASENNSANAADHKSVRQIVLVTDFQQGGKAEALQGHEWPKEVSLKALPVTVAHPGNASLQWVRATANAGPATPNAPPVNTPQADGTLRVNVTNQSDSTSEQFTLAWATEKGPLPGEPLQIYVAPGHSEVVKVPLPADGAVADRLVLAGDNCDFDNTLFLVPPRPETVRLVYLGDDAVTDVNASRYYLQSALFETPLRKFDVVARGGGGGGENPALVAADFAGVRMAVVSRPPSDGEIALLRQYVQEGGQVLWVGRDVATLQRAGALVGQTLQVTEATGDFALIGRVELANPLFSPFSDPRYADFTKIHFWHHRSLKIAGVEGGNAGGSGALNVLAAFDGGDPYILEQPLGKGTVLVFTSGWQPTDSQLALSSKFVPLLEEMVRRHDAIAIGAQYAVDEPIALPAVEKGGIEVVNPDGKATQLVSGATFSGDDKPGIYHLKAGGQDVAIAVNVAAEESRTMPISQGDLEQFGVKFTNAEMVKELAQQQRILLNNEQENRQKFWRWLLLGVLGLLAIETALAGRLSRSAFKERAAT